MCGTKAVTAIILDTEMIQNPVLLATKPGVWPCTMMGSFSLGTGRNIDIFDRDERCNRRQHTRARASF